MTLTEYIRQRRLTVAASDLLRGMKVIDTAMKYGYDSQDGFARAFVRFHGILPRDIRDHSARLNACSPLHVNLTLKGGIMMEYKIERTPSLRLLGIIKAVLFTVNLRPAALPYDEAKAAALRKRAVRNIDHTVRKRDR